jgi:hypothetical protein
MIGKEEISSQPTDTLGQEIMAAFLYASYLDSLNKSQSSKEEGLVAHPRRGAAEDDESDLMDDDLEDEELDTFDDPDDDLDEGEFDLDEDEEDELDEFWDDDELDDEDLDMEDDD